MLTSKNECGGKSTTCTAIKNSPITFLITFISCKWNVMEIYDAKSLCYLLDRPIGINNINIIIFQVKRFRFVHESSLCMLYGMIAGAVIRYSGNVKYQKGTIQHIILHIVLWQNYFIYHYRIVCRILG